MHAIKLSCSLEQFIISNDTQLQCRPLLSRIAPVIVFAVVIQYIHGYQRIVQVSSNCCLYRNCSCHSFDHALAHLTSNVLLNITTDVTLTSLAYVSNLWNISIIGHNNPTVNCKGAGGIHLFFCINCIIQGITWDECGFNNYYNNEPALQLTFAYNTTIQNCSFKHSREQAIASSKGLGYLNIKYCKFVHNSHYISAIISYSFLDRFLLRKLIPRHFRFFTSLRHRYRKSFSAMMDDIIAKSSQLSISIHGCDFSNNKGARRLIYINNLRYKQKIHFTISSSKFIIIKVYLFTSSINYFT